MKKKLLKHAVCVLLSLSVLSLLSIPSMASEFTTTAIRAEGTGDGEVTVTWDKVPEADGYLVYGKTGSDGDYHQLGITAYTDYVDETASNTEWNYYWVYPYTKDAETGELTIGKCDTYAYGKGIETDSADGESSLRAYYDKLTELQNEYGEVSVEAGAYGDNWLVGLCFARLVDFNNDGQDELVLVYCSGFEYDYPVYTLEVWEYNGKELEKKLTGDCWFNQEIFASVKFTQADGNNLLAQAILSTEKYAEWWGDAGSQEDWISGSAWFGYVENEMRPVHYLLYHYGAETASGYWLDGIDVSEQDLVGSESYARWMTYYESIETFWLTGDSEQTAPTIAELEKTLLILRNADREKGADSAWKLAYIDYITEVGSGIDFGLGLQNFDFYLVDINEDGIPELQVELGSVAEGSTISTYGGDHINTMYIDTYSFSYIPGENRFRILGGRQGSYYDYVYKIEDGQFVECGSGYYREADDMAVDQYGNPVYHYYWKDQEVDESTYNEMLIAIFDISKETRPYLHGTMTYEEVLAAIEAY